MKKLFLIVVAAMAASVCAYSQQAKSPQEGVAADGKTAVAEATVASAEKPAEAARACKRRARAGCQDCPRYSKSGRR